MPALVDRAQVRPKTVLALAALLAVASLAYAATGLEFLGDRTDLVHPSRQYLRNWRRYCAEFGGDADVVLLVEGDDRQTMIGAIDALAREIASHPRRFEKISYRIRIDKLRAKGLYQLPLSDLEQIGSRIDLLRPLLLGSWQWMTLDNVFQATRFRLSNLASGRPVDETTRQSLLSTTRLIESLDFHLRNGAVYRSPWNDSFGKRGNGELDSIPEYFFSDNGRTALMRVVPITSDARLGDAGRSIELLREIISRVQPVFPGLTFGMTGLPVLEHDEMQAAKTASLKAMLLSIAGVSILFTIAFRALRHPLFAIITLLIGGCWTLGWITLTVGHLNILSVSFIVTLIGLGIDFGILWLARYEADLPRCVTRRLANASAAASVGPGILVGATTTAAAFFTTMLTGFLGLREMGWIAGSGVLLCMLATFTVLPALLALAGGRPATTDRAVGDERPVFPWIARRPIAIVAVLGLVVVALATWIPKVRFDYNLLNLQARGLSSVKWEKRLVRQTGTSVWYALSIADSAEEARELRARFEAKASVGRVVEIASMLPADQPAKEPVIRAIHSALAKLPPESQAATLPPLRSADIQERLAELARAPLPKEGPDRDLVDRLTRAAERARRALFGMERASIDQRLAGFQELWLDDLIVRLNRLRDVSDPEPVTIADLPETLASRYRSPSGKWLLQIFAASSVWDIEPLERFAADVREVDPNATGKPISTLHALLEMNAGYWRSAALATLVIFVAVWIDLRNVVDTLLAMVPLALGCVSMFGVMGLTGIALNPANMIALPLILGIGVDFGVHMMHDYRQSTGAYRLTWRLARALLTSSLTTIVGFASLLVADHWGMASIGLVLAIGVATCTITALLIQPAILFLRSRARRHDDARDDEPADTVHYRQAA